MKSKRTVRMILIVLGALVFVMAFQFGYKPLAESNTQLTDQKMTLQTEVNQLKILWAQKEKMKDEIAELDEKSEASLDGIPSFVSQEDLILYVQGLVHQLLLLIHPYDVRAYLLYSFFQRAKFLHIT